jgi:Suppressor of fused protein (SUFU)
MQLTKYQAALAAFMFDHLPIGEGVDLDILEFSLEGDFFGKYHAAHCSLESFLDSERVVFTLPSFSKSVFVALCRGSAKRVARLLANLEDYERERSIQLGLGEVVVTPDQLVEQIGSLEAHAVILLRTATAIDCAQVPDCEIIDGRETSFLLVLPLSAEEYEIRRRLGHDALMDKFQIDGKDIFFGE